MIAEDFLQVLYNLGLCRIVENPDKGIKIRYCFDIDQGYASVAELSILEELETDVSHVGITHYREDGENKMTLEFNISEDKS